METEKKSKHVWAWALLGAVVALIIGVWVNYVGAYNYGNTQENRIIAEHKNLENVLGQYSLKVAEAAQVPEMYRDDMKDVVGMALEGRYGPDGSKAVFQWLKEDNSPARLDSTLYVKIQQIIEAGRNEYQNQQTRFIDIKRGYVTSLGYFWKGFWLKQAGYPKIDLKKYETTTSDFASEALSTGIDKGMTLRKK